MFSSAVTRPITEPFPQINVSFSVCYNVFISATGTKKVNMFDPNTTTQLLVNLNHTPSVLKLNIFLLLQAIIHDNFLYLSEKLLDMHSTLCLQFKIGDLIEQILDNWSHEKYRITIESFRRRNDCLILLKIGLWIEVNYFLKCGYSIKSSSWESSIITHTVYAFTIFASEHHTGKCIPISLISIN